MLRTRFVTTLPAMVLATALAGGTAAAQAVPGAADVGEYHERFVVDSNPFERSPRSGLIVEEALTGATGAPDTLVVPSDTYLIQESVIMSPVPAAIPDPTPAPGRAASTGLTPGAPLGSGGFTDRKVVAGENR